MGLLALYYNLSQINPDAKLDPARDRQLCIADLQLLLHLDRTLHRLHHARELRQQAIPSRADCTATMVLDQSVHPRKIGTQNAQRRNLIFADKAAIAFDISVKDRGELTLYAVRFHEKPSNAHGD